MSWLCALFECIPLFEDELDLSEGNTTCTHAQWRQPGFVTVSQVCQNTIAQLLPDPVQMWYSTHKLTENGTIQVFYRSCWGKRILMYGLLNCNVCSIVRISKCCMMGIIYVLPHCLLESHHFGSFRILPVLANLDCMKLVVYSKFCMGYSSICLYEVCSVCCSLFFQPKTT